MPKWFYREAKEHKGPVDEEELIKLAEAGTLKSTDLIWFDGLQAWRPASQLAWLKDAMKDKWLVSPPASYHSGNEENKT